MNTHKLTTQGQGVHAPKPEVAARQRAIGQANYDAAKASDVPVLITELRAHGSMSRACAAAGVAMSTLQNWRQRDAELNRDVQLAVRFAASEAVNYSAWVVQA